VVEMKKKASKKQQVVTASKQSEKDFLATTGWSGNPPKAGKTKAGKKKKK
jgi:hypothetical protein